MEPLPPDIAGLTWRPVTSDDLPVLAALAEDIRRADGGLAFLNNPQSLHHRTFGEAPGPGLGAFDAAGRLAAAVSLQLMSGAGEERVVIVGGVRPDLRGQGLGTYLLQWSAARSRAMFTAGAGKKRLLRIATESFTEPARRLFTTLGFENTLEALVMDRDLTLLILTTLPSLIQLYQTCTIHKTGTAIPMRETIQSVIPTQVDIGHAVMEKS